MSFFKAVKNIFTGNGEVFHKEDDCKDRKSLSDKAIEKGLMGVKKYYEVKIKLTNEITEINPEWEFYDRVTQENRVRHIEEKVEKLKKDKKESERLIEEQRDLGKERKCEYDNNLNEINELRMLYYKEFNMDKKVRIQNEINYHEQRNIDLIDRINMIEQTIGKCNANITKINEDIKNLKFLIITELALIPNKYEKCKMIGREYSIENNFMKLGLEVINEYNKGNIELAKRHTLNYYIEETNNLESIHHPIIDGLFAMILYEKGKLEKAKEVLGYVVPLYPDNIEIHRMLREIHNDLGEVTEAKLEDKIVRMLE